MTLKLYCFGESGNAYKAAHWLWNCRASLGSRFMLISLGVKHVRARRVQIQRQLRWVKRLH